MNEDYKYTYEYYSTDVYARKILPKIMVLDRDSLKIKTSIQGMCKQGLLDVEKIPYGKRGLFKFAILDSPYNANTTYAVFNKFKNTIKKIRVDKKCQIFYDEVKKIVKKRYKNHENIPADIDYKVGILNIRKFIPIGKWIDKGLEIDGKIHYLSFFYALSIVKYAVEIITERLTETNNLYFITNKGKQKKVFVWHKTF